MNDLPKVIPMGDLVENVPEILFQLLRKCGRGIRNLLI